MVSECWCNGYPVYIKIDSVKKFVSCPYCGNPPPEDERNILDGGRELPRGDQHLINDDFVFPSFPDDFDWDDD